jgi:hypothetical protein
MSGLLIGLIVLLMVSIYSAIEALLKSQGICPPKTYNWYSKIFG